MTTVERDYGALVGASRTHVSEKHSAIRMMRAVLPIFRAPHLEIKTYNITGEQHAYHRALRSEEVRIQFRQEAQWRIEAGLVVSSLAPA